MVDYLNKIKEMNENELQQELYDLNLHIFSIDMIDRWSEENRETYEILNKKLKVLEEEIDGRNK